MKTNEQLVSLINSNLHCFAIENHQGVRGPEMIDPVLVIAEDVKRALKITDCCELHIAEEVVHQAWLRAGDHSDLINEWVDSAGGYSQDADMFEGCSND